MKKILSAVLLGTLVCAALPVQAETPSQRSMRMKVEIQKAVQAIPEKVRTHVRFRGLSDDGTASKHFARICPAIFMDYNEANGLGNVTVGIREHCVKSTIEDSFVYAYTGMQFGVYRNDPKNQFMFFSNIYAKGNAYPKLILKKTARGNLYIYHMPVRDAALQEDFKQLFPTKKSFITLEKAASALRIMIPTID